MQIIKHFSVDLIKSEFGNKRKGHILMIFYDRRYLNYSQYE